MPRIVKAVGSTDMKSGKFSVPEGMTVSSEYESTQNRGSVHQDVMSVCQVFVGREMVHGVGNGGRCLPWGGLSLATWVL